MLFSDSHGEEAHLVRLGKAVENTVASESFRGRSVQLCAVYGFLYGVERFFIIRLCKRLCRTFSHPFKGYKRKQNLSLICPESQIVGFAETRLFELVASAVHLVGNFHYERRGVFLCRGVCPLRRDCIYTKHEGLWVWH